MHADSPGKPSSTFGYLPDDWSPTWRGRTSDDTARQLSRVKAAMRRTIVGSMVEAPPVDVVSGETGVWSRDRYMQIELDQLSTLDDDALDGVVAHEMGHVLQGTRGARMIRRAAIGAALITLAVPVIVLGAAALLPAIIAALAAANLAGSAVLRHYEYDADAFAAHALGSPKPLVAALEEVLATEKATPLMNLGGAGLVATHPATSRRIARLQRMPGGAADPFRARPGGMHREGL